MSPEWLICRQSLRVCILSKSPEGAGAVGPEHSLRAPPCPKPCLGEAHLLSAPHEAPSALCPPSSSHPVRTPLSLIPSGSTKIKHLIFSSLHKDYALKHFLSNKMHLLTDNEFTFSCFINQRLPVRASNQHGVTGVSILS